MILSVVPMFRGPNDSNGHFASVQMGFAEAAKQMGVPFAIYNGKQFWQNDDSETLRIVADIDPTISTYANIEKWLLKNSSLDGVTLLIFEGYLESVRGIADFARNHPNIRIYINLFYPEPGLSIPGTYDHFVGQTTTNNITNQFKDIINVLRELTNIRLACDTDARSFLARSLGIRIDETWYGRSPISRLAVDLINPKNECRNQNNEIKVFITVDINRFTYFQLWWCINVIRFTSSLNNYQKNRLIWTFNFLPEEVSAKYRFLLHFLPKKNTKFVQHKVTLDLYAKRIHEADIVWLPLSPYYASSSSGRVCDAIMLSKPILTPSGTYGHFEFSKWISNWPTYRNQMECAQILLNLNHLLPLANQLLSSQANSIREYYSNINQLKRVIGSEVVTHRIDHDKNMVNVDVKLMEDRISIFNFAKALLNSLGPSFQLRLVKLITFGAKRSVLRIFKC